MIGERRAKYAEHVVDRRKLGEDSPPRSPRVLIRGHTNNSLEPSIEVALIAIAHGVGDFGKARASTNHPLCVHHTKIVEVGVRRQAELHRERAGQMKRTRAAGCGQFG